MCVQITDGIIKGCGHYERTAIKGKIDCGSRTCTKSDNHPRKCGSRCYATCKQHYGPDQETILSRERPFCHYCEAWSREPPPPPSRYPTHTS